MIDRFIAYFAIGMMTLALLTVAAHAKPCGHGYIAASRTCHR